MIIMMRGIGDSEPPSDPTHRAVPEGSVPLTAVKISVKIAKFFAKLSSQTRPPPKIWFHVPGLISNFEDGSSNSLSDTVKWRKKMSLCCFQKI
eukprot:g12826.t1